jgi:hypothetical protein
VFSTVSFTLVWWALVVTRTVPCSGRLRTIALCTRFALICSSSAGEPMVGVMSPEVSMVMPRCCASGRSVSVASSARRDRSTCSGVHHAAFTGGVTRGRPARATTQRIRMRRRHAVGVLVTIVAIVAALGSKSLVPSRSMVPSPSSAASLVDRSRSEQHGALGEAGGAVPDGTTVFDDAVPGVANLDPALLRALRQAATDAADDGVEFVVDSGWRSPEHQEHVLNEAVLKYGSQERAIRWVATPTPLHTSRGTRSTRGASNRPRVPRLPCACASDPQEDSCGGGGGGSE